MNESSTQYYRMRDGGATKSRKSAKPYEAKGKEVSEEVTNPKNQLVLPGISLNSQYMHGKGLLRLCCIMFHSLHLPWEMGHCSHVVGCICRMILLLLFTINGFDEAFTVSLSPHSPFNE